MIIITQHCSGGLSAENAVRKSRGREGEAEDQRHLLLVLRLVQKEERKTIKVAIIGYFVLR